MTLKSYLDALNNMVKENPAILDFPVIYASNDGANEYNKVFFYPQIAQVEDLSIDSFFEIVGYMGEKNINKVDCNAVVIN
jgi:hypothetical protein